jgi:hypothetical protein
MNFAGAALSTFLVVGCSGDSSRDSGPGMDAGPRNEGIPGPGTDAGPRNEAITRVPTYTASGLLERPDDWPGWTFLGAGLGLSYASGSGGENSFTTVFMEPTAFAYFKATGEFHEGTMTALAVYEGATGAPPAHAGTYPGALVGFEMSVKDSARAPATKWSYYAFGTTDTVAAANPADSCFSCHDENAETDHVFTQFDPALP